MVFSKCRQCCCWKIAAYISKLLRGKNKPQFNPNIDNGDFVIVTNIEKIKFTGKKFTDKKYYKHTGYPGGIKETKPFNLKEKINLKIFLNLQLRECCLVDH